MWGKEGKRPTPLPAPLGHRGGLNPGILAGMGEQRNTIWAERARFPSIPQLLEAHHHFCGPQSWGGTQSSPAWTRGSRSPRGVQNSSPGGELPLASPSQTLGSRKQGTREDLLIYFSLPPPLLTKQEVTAEGSSWPQPRGLEGLT